MNQEAKRFQEEFHYQVWQRPWEVIAQRKQELKERGESLVERLGLAPLPTRWGDFTLVAYGDKTTGEEHFALISGDYLAGSLGSEDVLVRVHSSCITSEVFDAINCECPEQRREVLGRLGREGGVLVYLHQEGRGNGTMGKMAQLANMFHFQEGAIMHDTDTDTAFKMAGYEGERRDFTVAGEILHDIGVKSVRLLTNNPKKIEGLIEAGIEVLTREPVEIEPGNGIVALDLISKRDNLGHMIGGEIYGSS